MVELENGEFDVGSPACEMSIWDYKSGDTWSWSESGDVLQISRPDGETAVSLFEFPPEMFGYVDCLAYFDNLDLEAGPWE